MFSFGTGNLIIIRTIFILLNIILFLIYISKISKKNKALEEEKIKVNIPLAILIIIFIISELISLYSIYLLENHFDLLFIKNLEENNFWRFLINKSMKDIIELIKSISFFILLFILNLKWFFIKSRNKKLISSFEKGIV